MQGRPSVEPDSLTDKLLWMILENVKSGKFKPKLEFGDIVIHSSAEMEIYIRTEQATEKVTKVLVIEAENGSYNFNGKYVRRVFRIVEQYLPKESNPEIEQLMKVI